MREAPAVRIATGPTATTDIGNAQRFAYYHGTDLRFLAGAEYWLAWDGRRWRRDDLLEADRRAKETTLAIIEEVRAAQDDLDDTARKALLKHAIASQSDQRIRAMLRRARAEHGMAILQEDLDRDPWLFNVANGTLDLRTGSLQPHCREHFITRLAPVAFDPDARCPRWERFVCEITKGDAELGAYLQRAIGYSLTGDTREECFFCLHGSGSNGKSKMLETLRALFGDYAAQAKFHTFLEQRGGGPRPDIARLAGARLVTAVEVGENARLSESVIKSITGGDTVTERELYQRDFEFRPQFKLILAANHKPIIGATDRAMWRRVHLIPFDVTFDGASRDDQLSAKLEAERPGILRWAVEGCLAWLERGLRPPERVLAATAAYKAESDTLGEFLEECCIVEIGSTFRVTDVADLSMAYRRWSDERGDQGLNSTLFGRKLGDRGFPAVKRHGCRARVGIQLRAEWRGREGLEGLEGSSKTPLTRARDEGVYPAASNPPRPSPEPAIAALGGVR